MPYSGFPRDVRFTPVPSQLLGPLLEEIDHLGELKCTLRLIWLLNQKKGFPRSISLAELLADEVLVKSLGNPSEGVQVEIRRSLERAVRRGTIASIEMERNGVKHALYTLNTEANRKWLSEMMVKEGLPPSMQPLEAIETQPEQPNIYSLYENNIGLLSPMIADQLREAEETYPLSWIEDAFREAVSLNKRNWRYIARILENWRREVRTNGGPS